MTYKLLVTTDFSDESMQAFEFAKEFAELKGKDSCQITVLNVIDDAVPVSISFGFGIAMAETDGVIENIKKIATDKLAKIKDEQFSKYNCETALLEPDFATYEKITRYAKDNQIDQIIISSHGRTGLQHLVIGSVAERVVRATPCAVTVIPIKK